jgi:hypothetical protein
MAAGAAVGKMVRPPWLALVLAFGSHFLLDTIPHLDSHGLFGVKGRPTLGEGLAGLFDLLIGIALVILAVRRQTGRRLMILAAFSAILIDLVDNIPPWGTWFRAWPGTSWLSSFHHGIQHNVTPADWPLGFGTQIAVVAIALFVLRSRKPRVPA